MLDNARGRKVSGSNCARLLMLKLLMGEQPCLCLDELASVGLVVAYVTL